MTATPTRPRIVSVAFWCWLVAAIVLILAGMVAVSSSTLPTFFRGAGVVWIVAGALLSYLSGRARRGDIRFCRAAVGLSFGLAVLLVMFIVMSRALMPLLVLLLVVVAAVLVLRPAAQQWYAQGGSPESDV